MFGPVIAVIVGTVAIWVGVRWLEPAAAQIAHSYRIPSIVHGAILVAAASSFPELASVVLAAARHGEFELGVAIVIGSAIFNVLVIPAVAVFADGGPVDTNKELVYKDAQFYLLAIVVTLLMFALAVVYVPVTPGETSGSVTRVLALIPLALYGLYLSVHYIDVTESGPAPSDAYKNARRAFAGFVGGIAIILVGVEALLYAAMEFGTFFGTPSFLWGLTVVAIATSLPDLLLSVQAMQAGRPVVSLSNVFGSNVFDLLVAIPAGVLVAGSMVVHLERAVPMFGFLVIATIATMASLRTALAITRREAVLLGCLYGVFVLWVLLESLGIVGYF